MGGSFGWAAAVVLPTHISMTVISGRQQKRTLQKKQPIPGLRDPVETEAILRPKPHWPAGVCL